MFVLYNVDLESFRSMADRFGTSKDSLHVNVTRVLSTLLEIMPKEIKWSKTLLINKSN